MEEKIEYLICSNEPTKATDEREVKCSRCGCKAFISQDWFDKPNAKNLCMKCYKRSRIRGKVVVEDRVVEEVNKALGKNLTKEDYETIMMSIKPEKIKDKELTLCLRRKEYKDYTGNSTIDECSFCKEPVWLSWGGRESIKEGSYPEKLICNRCMMTQSHK